MMHENVVQFRLKMIFRQIIYRSFGWVVERHTGEVFEGELTFINDPKSSWYQWDDNKDDLSRPIDDLSKLLGLAC